MRSTRITALGIVIFLFLQAALSSCLRIGGKPKYDIDEDSLFFSRMPPRTETGTNIVAFEFDGKPYVFPKEGMRDYPVFFLQVTGDVFWQRRRPIKSQSMSSRELPEGKIRSIIRLLLIFGQKFQKVYFTKKVFPLGVSSG